MIWCLCFPFVEADTVSQIEIVFLSPETASRNLPEVFSSLINSDVQEPHSELQAGIQSHIKREKIKCLSLNCSWQIRAGAGISRCVTTISQLQHVNCSAWKLSSLWSVVLSSPVKLSNYCVKLYRDLMALIDISSASTFLLHSQLA